MPGPGARRPSGSSRAAPPSAWSLGLELEPPAEGLEAVRFVLRRLVAALADQLAVRGQAAGLARLTVTHDLAFARRGTPPRAPDRAAAPGAHRRRRGHRAPAPRSPGNGPAASRRRPPGAGVALVEPARGQQLPLFTPQAARDARLGWQLARLAITFGADRVRRVELIDPEAPLPEARWRWVPAAGAAVMGEDPR